MTNRPRCPRCESILPGNVTHDTEADCISALRGRLTIKESALTEARLRYQRKRDSVASRVERLEQQLEITETKIRAVEDTCARALARAHFAVGQLGTVRRAS